MNKMISSFKALATLLIASAAFAACSNIDNDTEQTVNHAGKYTMIVNATKGNDDATRALSLDDSGGKNKLNTTWNAGEKVIVYQDGSKIGTLTAAESSTASTTLSGTLDSDPVASKDLTFYFHTATPPSYSGQDGTLAKIASTYDFCAPVTVATGNFSVNTGNKTVTVTDDITFDANQQAIAKFTLLDKADGTGNTKLSPSALTVTVDLPATYMTTLQSSNEDLATALSLYLPYENSLTIPETTYSADDGGEGIIYLAIPDRIAAIAEIPPFASYVTDIKSNIQITLTATVGSETYMLTKSGFSFVNGKYHEITAKMTKQAPAARALSAATTDDIGKIAGADGYIYDDVTAATAAGTTAEAMIAYVGSATGDATYKHGLAIALVDESITRNWSTAKSTCEGKTPVTNAKWHLPSQDQWKIMFRSNGGNDSKYNALNAAIGNAGGTALRVEQYWSSSEVATNSAYFMLLKDGGVFFNNGNKANTYRVRACIAF